MALLNKKITVNNNIKLTLKKLKLNKEQVVIDEDMVLQAIKLKMPNVVGLSIKEAIAVMNNNGIKFTLRGKEVIPKEGSVYKQDPAAGTTISLKTEATLYVNDYVMM